MALRDETTHYPEIALRELFANAIIYQRIIEFLVCEVVLAQHVDMALCYRRINGSCVEQVFTGFFIRCFFE